VPASSAGTLFIFSIELKYLPSMNEKTVLQDQAKSLGFSLCGVTSPAPTAWFGRYQDWLTADRQAGMSYLATEKARQARKDPQVLVPEAKSIIVLAAMYSSPTALPTDEHTGGIAAYALGDDYHELLSKRMWQLCRVLDDLAGRSLRHRVYTDSGPVLERELGVRAGLGWIGKNSMLIHPKFGSHFFLGEIISEFFLPPDPPFLDDPCGTCDRCLRACPTGCILADRTVDSGRCLAYLTIEHRGAIPKNLRHQMGQWVFGCDVCQSVCPWNQKSDCPVDLRFQTRPHFPLVNLAAELDLTEPDFRNRFHQSPFRRTRREGYRRNVIIAIGNARLRAAVPSLAHILMEDPNPVLRGHASWALGQMGTEEAQAILQRAIRDEKDASVHQEIQEALMAS
jgi:epoxyqueuosine reductase